MSSSQKLRIARPTSKIDAMVTFYRDGLGMQLLGGFKDHDGYDGVMLGMAEESWHLEFTSLQANDPVYLPSKDHLLVFYCGDESKRQHIAKRLAGMGYPAVKAQNPYWTKSDAITIEDPDGFRVVLACHK